MESSGYLLEFFLRRYKYLVPDIRIYHVKILRRFINGLVAAMVSPCYDLLKEAMVRSGPSPGNVIGAYCETVLYEQAYQNAELDGGTNRSVRVRLQFRDRTSGRLKSGYSYVHCPAKSYYAHNPQRRILNIQRGWAITV